MPIERRERSQQFPRYSKRVIDSVMEVGGERVVGLFDKVYEIDPDFAELYVEYVRGSMYSRSVLSQPIRELCACAALTLLNCPGLLKAHLLNGAYVGATKEELLEAIIQMVVYGGFPATLTAIDTFREVFPDAAVPDRPAFPAMATGLAGEPYYEPALRNATRLFGDDHARSVLDRANGVDGDWSQAIQRLVYGGVLDRDVVSVKVRQLLAVTGCIVSHAWEDLEEQIRAGLRVGLNRAEIQEVVVQMSVYLGLPHAFRAAKALESVADEWERRKQ